MTIGTIFVPAGSAGPLQQSLDGAAVLARVFGSRVELWHAMTPPDVPVGLGFYIFEPAFLAEMNGETRAAAAESLRATRQAFEAARLRTGLPDGAATVTGPSLALRAEALPAPFGLAYAARTADLVVMGGQSESLSFAERELRETILFESGTPALLFPEAFPAHLPKRALIAWNGSREAAAAMRGALPLLRQMEKTRVLSIGKLDDWRQPPAAAAAFLRHHGVPAIDAAQPDVKAPIEDQLVAEAQSFGAELLVLGAFSHSRLREMIVGGVTRSLLAQPPMPILMVH